MIIGVICEERQRLSVLEFFELFKTPWEFYNKGNTYEVVIIAGKTEIIPEAKLLIVFGSEKNSWDVCQAKIQRAPDKGGVLLEHNGDKVPVYSKIALFESSFKPLMKVSETSETAGVEFAIGEKRFIRIGYDLFDEVEYLLSHEQPVEHAEIPALDVQIHMLRQWLIHSGFLLVEIAPQPSGYNFMVCLTHDVDFINITDHGVDRSLIGFIGRALWFSHLRDTRSRVAWSRLFKNWKAVLSLPAVYLGLGHDVWFDIDRYRELEDGLASTYFFIPIRNHPGNPSVKEAPPWRAARYDVKEYKTLVCELKRGGFEIGLHGLDAWQDAKKGSKEREIICETSEDDCIGVRMHWLYFFENSPKCLEEGGFTYDSTMGYNEAVGFRSGTTQVFRLPGASEVFELPLNVMDTALFYPDRMGLQEAEALDLCREVIGNIKKYGGVLTINWHTRSLNPERNWDAFYIELLDILKKEKVWFASGKGAVNWFRSRRRIRYDALQRAQNGLKVRLTTGGEKSAPGFLLRVHLPAAASETEKNDPYREGHCIEIPFNNDEKEIEITV